MIEKEIIISVILSVYNCERYLNECIDSILDQTFNKFELIIINDGSTDKSEEIILKYNDSRIVYIKNKENLGLVESLNKGIFASQGKYIARIDADDIAFPNRLQAQYDYMESHSEIGICGSFVEAFSDKSDKKQLVGFAIDDLAIRAFAFFHSPFCHPSVMIRKERLDTYHLKYPNTYFRAEDYGLWIELLKYTKGANINIPLLHYRKHENSETALGDKKLEEKADIIIRLHTQYLAQNNIALKPEQMRVYTRFTDRSFPFDLNQDNQKEVDQVLKDFLSQLSQQNKDLYPDTFHFLSMICFYKFFANKKLPITFLLQKLFLKGSYFYFKKIFPGSKII